MSCDCPASVILGGLLAALQQEEQLPNEFAAADVARVIGLLRGQGRPDMRRVGTDGCADLLTTQEAAQRHRVHRKTIERWCREGRFDGARKVGRHWRVPSGVRPRPAAFGANEPPPDVGGRRAGSAHHSQVRSAPGGADAAFAQLLAVEQSSSHGTLRAEQQTKGAPRDAPTSGGPGTGRKEASTMKHATAGSPAHANVHAIGRKGRR